jgi:hypothetical protein
MRRATAVSCRVVLFGIVACAFVLVSALLPPSAASALPANSGAASSAERMQAQLSPVLKTKVICQQLREGKNIRTFSCPDNNTCVNVSGAWKCRPPVAAPMACSVCYNNQKRDSDACARSGNLMSQSDCVNRANAALMKCLGSCR